MRVKNIVLIVSIVLLVWCSSLLIANADIYKTLGVSHGVPLTCVFEPDPRFTHDQSRIMNASETAIKNWEASLNEYNPNGYWELRIVGIPFELHDGKKTSNFPAASAGSIRAHWGLPEVASGKSVTLKNSDTTPDSSK